MTILTFTGEDSATAMEKMADQLGENCFILSTTKRGNQIEISATDNPAEAGWGSARRSPANNLPIFSPKPAQKWPEKPSGNNSDNRRLCRRPAVTVPFRAIRSRLYCRFAGAYGGNEIHAQRHGAYR